MTATTPLASPRARLDRSELALRAVLLGVLAFLAGATVLLGSLDTPLRELDSALASGRVTHVRTVGALPADFTGSSAVEFHWREGWTNRYAQAVQVRLTADKESPGGMASSSSHAPTIETTPAEHVKALAPGVTVTEEAAPDGTVGRVALWQVPVWIAIGALTWWLLVVGTLIVGPEPRLATKWAWFWLFTSALAVPAMAVYLLAGRPASEDDLTPPGRRLRGGWAFVLLLFLRPF